MGNTIECLCHLGYICVPTLNCVCPAFRGFFLPLVVTLWAVFSLHLLLCSLPSFRVMYSTFFWAQFLPTMGLLLTLSVVSLTLTPMHLFPALPFFISRFLIKLLLLRKYFYLLSSVRTVLSLSFPHRSSYSSLDFTSFPFISLFEHKVSSFWFLNHSRSLILLYSYWPLCPPCIRSVWEKELPAHSGALAAVPLLWPALRKCVWAGCLWPRDYKGGTCISRSSPEKQG